MLRASLVIFALMMSTAAVASDWTEISSDSNAHFYVDLATVDRKGTQITFWLKTIKNSDAIRTKFAEAYTLDRRVVNCVQRRILMLSTIGYDESGLVRFSVDVPQSLRAWQPITPDSIGEAIFERLCQKP